MKFGFNTTMAQFPVAATCGADYLDLSITEFAEASEEDFAAFLETVKASGVEVYSGVVLVPGDLRLTGDVDFDAVRAYAKKAFARMAALGIRTPVFGSGKAKQVPDGFPMEKAWEQLYEVAGIFADEAEKYGMTVVLEALRHSEVNIVNTIDDAADYAAHVGRESVKILADFYHMNENGEDLSVLDTYKDILRHIHLCSPRRNMTNEGDTAFVRERLALLKRIGYEGRISFEGGKPDDCAGMREMLDEWRRIYAEA